MTENKNKQVTNQSFKWLLSIVLAATTTTAWYYIGTLLYNNKTIGQRPQQWGLPIVFLIMLTCAGISMKKLNINIKRRIMPNIDRRGIFYLIVSFAIIAFLFSTRYRIVKTEGSGFYKINRWTGSTYYINGGTAEKVIRTRESKHKW